MDFLPLIFVYHFLCLSLFLFLSISPARPPSPLPPHFLFAVMTKLLCIVYVAVSLKSFDVLLLSVVSQPNHLARVLFDIIFVNFEFNIARRLCATCHALGSRKTKKEKKIVTKTEVTFKEWGGGKTTRN